MRIEVIVMLDAPDIDYSSLEELASASAQAVVKSVRDIVPSDQKDKIVLRDATAGLRVGMF